MYIHPPATDRGTHNMTSMSNLPASPRRVVTVRDFLTDKHGFTLPASRLHSYTETLKHTSSSLFRHPKVFSVHYHASVFETDCHTPLEKDKWERGEYFEEGQTTVWAHFVRIPGVDIFGKALAKSEERVRHPVRIRRRSHLLRLSDASEDRVEKRAEKRTKRKERLLEGYSLPPPNSSPHPYYSQYTEIVPLPQEENEEAARRVRLAPPFRGFQHPVATNAYSAPRRAVPENCRQKARVEISLLEPEPEVEVRIKPELPLGWSDDEGGFDWDFDDY